MKAITRFGLFLGITLFLFILYGLLFQNMGLDSDFFGVLQNARLASSWKEYWTTSVAQMVYPLNEMRSETNFGSFYRPMWQQLHLIEWYLFGSWWLGYVLGAILFFGMTAGILAVIFSYFFPAFDATILALLWATHPALSPSLLSVTVLLSSSYFFIALSALLYLWYFQKKGSFFYLGSLLFYAAGALSYDLLIISPMPLFLFLLFFYRSRLQEIIPYFMVTLSCIGLRIFMMGTPAQTSTFNPLAFIKMSLDNVIQTARPFWGLQNSSTLIALLLSLFFMIWILWHFIKEKKERLYILWLSLSFIIGSWGILIGNSSSRYFCLGLPFFVLLLYDLIHYSFSKKTASFLLFLIISLSGSRTFNNFAQREKYTHARDIAMHEVLKEYPSSCYFFLIMPHFCKHEIFLLSSGLMQGLQLFSGNDDLQVYHLIDFPLCTIDFPSKGNIETEAIENGYRLKITDPHSMWFMIPHNAQTLKNSMGEIIINERISSWQAIDVSVILNETYQSKEWLDKTRIFSWNPQSWKFIPVSSEHLVHQS